MFIEKEEPPFKIGNVVRHKKYNKDWKMHIKYLPVVTSVWYSESNSAWYFRYSIKDVFTDFDHYSEPNSTNDYLLFKT